VFEFFKSRALIVESLNGDHQLYLNQ